MAYFAEVVERGSFAAAARALRLTKSLLSRRVADLESNLGVRLLQRTTRKLSLTQAGEIYLRHCVAMREEARAGDEAIAQVQTEPRGTLRLSCPVTLAQATLAPLIPRFLALHPHVNVDMLVTNRVIDLVEEGIDVALRVRPTMDASGSLVVKNLGKTYAHLVATPAQLERQGWPQSPEQLSLLDTVSMAGHDGRASWRLLGPAGREFDFQHRPRYIADDLLTLKAAVLDATGICALPDYMCKDELATGRLVLVLEGWAPLPNVVHAVFPSRRGLVPAVRSFLDFLGEEVRGAADQAELADYALPKG